MLFFFISDFFKIYLFENILYQTGKYKDFASMKSCSLYKNANIVSEPGPKLKMEPVVKV